MAMHLNPRPVYRMTRLSLHIDYPLFFLLTLLLTVGMLILYSASNQNIHLMCKQGLHILAALGIMIFMAGIPPHKYKNWTPWLYGGALGLLISVMIIGKVGKGAQRWLDLGLFRFQPSELMKLALPMMTAWYFENSLSPLPIKKLFGGSLIVLLPTMLIAKQPDLGTAISVALGGSMVIFLAGISFKMLGTLLILCVSSTPMIWHFLHAYQKQRIFTLLDPERDPLGAGYHIIQSKIAIGSGGFTGKGWLQGSQAHLNFLPEHTTDFIFAVTGEEWGFMGCLLLILFICLITLRGLRIAMYAQTEYTKLLAASLILSFFFSAFINMGMVMGILPVVGIPLPLISYGGSALITFLATFGIIMSISTHRILFTRAL